MIRHLSWSRASLLSRRDRGREAAPAALRFMELGCLGQLGLCTEKPARMFFSTVTLQVMDKTREISMTIEKLQNRCKIKKVIELRWLRGFRCSVTIYFQGRVCRRGQRVAIMWLHSGTRDCVSSAPTSYWYVIFRQISPPSEMLPVNWSYRAAPHEGLFSSSYVLTISCAKSVSALMLMSWLFRKTQIPKDSKFLTTFSCPLPATGLPESGLVCSLTHSRSQEMPMV